MTKYNYFTQTNGFPDVQISLIQAIKIVKRFRKMKKTDIIKALHSWIIDNEIICSESVRVWAEEVR